VTNALQNLADAQREGHYTFCKTPKVPLSPNDQELCPLARATEGCEGLVAACRGDLDAKTKSGETSEDAAAKHRDPSSHTVPGALGALAQGLVWLLMLAVVVAVAIPLVRALLRARRDKALADAPKPPNVAVATVVVPPPLAESISDAEAALRDADEHARRGELTRALGLYLAASLAALDRRGAIRLARSRTNGEYVRACAEDESRTALREIVREVDRVEFGHLPPTTEGVALIASRATRVVRSSGGAGARGISSIATMALSLLLALAALSGLGCGDSSGRSGHRNGVDDPSGDELPLDLLRRAGFDASYLTTSLAAIPVPGAADAAPIVVVDVLRVALEEESSAHLLRWVEAGGVLVLFGPPAFWPAELGVTPEFASSDHVDVVTGDVFAAGARVGNPHALSWPSSETIAWTDKSVYAAHRSHGKGAVIGVAGHELATNIGVVKPENAAAFAALFDVAVEDHRTTTAEREAPVTPVEIRFARRTDGIAPPSNPFSALVQAGLGRGSWHALAAAMVLFLAFGVRQARPRPVAPQPRRAFAEHVEATGAFYGRARALGHALASYGRFAEMRVRERIPRGGDPVQFLAARAKVPVEDAARVWKRATEASAEDPPRGDELTTIRDLGAMLAKALETSR
jgi:hypothetical protein